MSRKPDDDFDPATLFLTQKRLDELSVAILTGGLWDSPITLRELHAVVRQARSEPARLASAKAEGVREGTERCASRLEEKAAGFLKERDRHMRAWDETKGTPAETVHSRRACSDESTAALLSDWAAELRRLSPPPAEPSAPVAPEGEAKATRYLERLVENAAPPPTRPLYGDLIGLCTQVDNLLCYVREQGKERIAALEAENAKLLALLDEFAGCARYDPLMSGPRFAGWNWSALERTRVKVRDLFQGQDTLPAATVEREGPST